MNINLANLFVITNPNYVPEKLEIPHTAAALLGSAVESKQKSNSNSKEQIK